MTGADAPRRVTRVSAYAVCRDERDRPADRLVDIAELAVRLVL